jgi:hypothetical protein
VLNLKKHKKNIFLIILIAILLFTTPCYALVKIFHIDDTLKNWFSLSDEELEDFGISSSIVNLEKEFADATIIINETILDEKELYISVSVTGKTQKIYLENAYILEDYENNSFGFGLIEENDLTNNYVLTTSIDNIEIPSTITLRLISDTDNIYDIPFTLSKNDMKEKEVKYDAVVYNENDLVVTIKSIRLTPLHVIIDMEYNKDIRTLSQDELDDIGNKVYNDNNNDTNYVTYKDGSRTTLRLWYTGLDDSMLSPYGIHGTKEDQVNDIENIKSITINNVTLEIA